MPEKADAPILLYDGSGDFLCNSVILHFYIEAQELTRRRHTD